MGKGGNIHTGHRERMRKRFMKEGNLDNFNYHEILEMILYFTVKRSDTNALAHKMINSFGSFHNLLNASVEDIMDICNVSESTAFAVSILPHIAKRYKDSQGQEGITLTTKNQVVEYLKSMVSGKSVEEFYLICLDGNYKVIASAKLAEGTKAAMEVRIEHILGMLIKYKVSFALIAHNHPGNTCVPSNNDIAATDKIIQALDIINVVLLDHIIICANDSYSFAQNHLCGLEY